MSKSILNPSDGDHAIQAMPLIQGKINLVDGTFIDISLIHCALSGDITLNWKNGETSTTVSCEVGNNFSIAKEARSVTIVPNSGLFHLA